MGRSVAPSEEGSAAQCARQSVKRAQLPPCGLGAGPHRADHWGCNCHRLMAHGAEDLKPVQNYGAIHMALV